LLAVLVLVAERTYGLVGVTTTSTMVVSIDGRFAGGVVGSAGLAVMAVIAWKGLYQFDVGMVS